MWIVHDPELCYKLEGATVSMHEVVRTEGCENIH
jgi:hypothetical protein